VTLIDVIIFRDEQQAADPVLWAHELTHVEQYDRLGVEAFAVQYLQQAWVLGDHFRVGAISNREPSAVSVFVIPQQSRVYSHTYFAPGLECSPRSSGIASFS
jgi:uncharacterized protein DUF4157